MTGVADDLPYGKPELVIKLSPRGAALGFTNDEIGRQVRNALEGAIPRRFVEGTDEIAVRVIGELSEQGTAALRNLQLRTNSGVFVPLREVADITERQGFSAIQRRDGKSTISVTADIDSNVTTPGEVIERLREEGTIQAIASKYGVETGFSGRAQERQKAFVDLDMAALNSSTTDEVFKVFGELRQFIDTNAPGRDWNVATSMVINGEAGMQIMGDWAKGEFAVAGKNAGTDFVCVAAPGTSDGFTFNVDSFAFFQQADVNKQNAQKAMAEEILGTSFQEVFNLNKGSIPARLGMARTKFDSCAHDSMNAFVSTAQSGGLVPSFAHGMAVPGAVAGAITDVATNYFNSKTSPAEGKAQLVAAIQAAM